MSSSSSDVRFEAPAHRLLDLPTPSLFDRYTRLAARILDVPIALITLVDNDWHYIQGSFGLPDSWKSTHRLPYRSTCCDLIVAAGRPVMVPNVYSQPAMIEHIDPLQLGVVAYAGVPLQTDQGQILGALCAIDTIPHDWNSIDRENLEDLASMVVEQIVLHKTVVERSRAEQSEIGKFKGPGIANPVFEQQQQSSNMETASEFRMNGITANDLNFWSDQYNRALVGEQFHFEYQRVVDGVEGWFDISLNPIRVNGTVTGVSIISREISQRILQEQQRLELERTQHET